MSRITHARSSVRAALALLVTGSVVALFALAAPTQAASNHAPNQATGHATASHLATQHHTGLITMRGTTTDGRHFRGTFRPTSFEVVDGALMATGDVRGWLVGKGRPTPVAAQQVTTQVLAANGTSLTGAGAGMARPSAYTTSGTHATTAALVPAAAACPILNLKLAPLDLDVLGLQVHLDQVVLNIVAQSGAGELLGNLLCAVAGLLDGGSPLSQLLGQLSTLLNQILGVLGGLPV